ncbi:xylulokinase [Usitatibacter palustris]|uniref:Xylulose kinase n=1 Tax=Usitatibacter palustris TaxID=2732487 RepID=A0A6M4H6J0_9PROT|nr:xylulokinase [Usitatibacter palustris]QJR15236.1 Xylulose kinase [Usitatibacter palustris]
MNTVGIDVGTSSVKVALVGEDDRVIATASRPLEVSRPKPGFSEQDPQHWWQALVEGLDELKAKHPSELADVVAIGLSGHMHGATLLDDKGEVLRPCILWNDVRSMAQCEALTAKWPGLHSVTGNLAMPGFTAPKLMWVREHEPEIFKRVAKVLLPKAYVRYRLCGLYIEEMSDASGTSWLDVGARDWSKAALDATGMRRDQMPDLVEGDAVSGELNAELTRRWGFKRAPVIAGGAGDNAAGAVGLGAIHAGDAFVSLGTSGVLWATTAAFAPAPARGVHAFCHAVPNTWHQMGVLLSAAGSLAWWSQVAGADEGKLLAEIDASRASSACWFAPYLNGERTPHNDAAVRGGFAGLDGSCTRADMTLSVLEGVAYAMRDAQEALASAGTKLSEADIIGGGARSPLWSQLMADVLGIPLHQVAESEIGCALGAARLARLAAGEPLSSLKRPARVRTFAPRADRVSLHTARHRHWQGLYAALSGWARA